MCNINTLVTSIIYLQVKFLSLGECVYVHLTDEFVLFGVMTLLSGSAGTSQVITSQIGGEPKKNHIQEFVPH